MTRGIEIDYWTGYRGRYPFSVEDAIDLRSTGIVYPDYRKAKAAALILLENIFDVEMQVNYDHETLLAAYRQCRNELLDECHTRCELPFCTPTGVAADRVRFFDITLTRER